ncbi:hypothetical protein DBR12_02200 [Acidovorax sp. HMWF029]|uniref:hypothetical protein n=1 Tax=Acidovorax sp. HMWF029 TaxID=2056863 RepID=UPI000D37C542|nr:hypothetical protein [Acidovorax sp. HMWF029]PTT23180.1 hypothetical protein DBR12_02200 [Acidovorax sp. HMWF029]
MSRWAFWRKRPPVTANGAVPPSRRVTADFSWLGDALQLVLAWLLPSGAVVVGALGQFMLALVLLMVAFGVWLRLWRSRKRRRAMGRAPR